MRPASRQPSARQAASATAAASSASGPVAQRQLVEGFHLVLVGIGGGVAARHEMDFADADDARAGAGAEQADGEFAAGQEGLDQRRLAVGLQHLEAFGGERRAVGDLLVSCTPLEVPSASGLTNSG